MDCVIKRIYATLCRDPDTGEGGLAPTSSEFHADAFRRMDTVYSKNTAKGGADRLLEIDYGGTLEYGRPGSGSAQKRRSWHKLILRIGYFMGDNRNATNMVVAADDKLIGTYLQEKDAIKGGCDSLCLEKVEVIGSNVIKLDEQRLELQISLKVQVL